VVRFRFPTQIRNYMTSAISTTVKRLDEIAKSASEVFSGSSFESAIQVAETITELRANLTPEIMARFMDLQNSSLGFRTDRDPTQGKEAYGIPVVKECLIEATLRGVPPVGNCFNIISARTYITRQGFEFLLKKFPGFSNFVPELGIPRIVANSQSQVTGAIVNAQASWQVNGVKSSLACEIPVKINAGMGSDAILGKAMRKLLARVHSQISGSVTLPEGEAGDEPEQITTTPMKRLTSTGLPKKSEAKSEPVKPAAPVVMPPPAMGGGYVVQNMTAADAKSAINQHPAAELPLAPEPEPEMEDPEPATLEPQPEVVAGPAAPAAEPIDPELHAVIQGVKVQLEEAGHSEHKIMDWGQKGKHWPKTVGSLLGLYLFDKTKFAMVARNLPHIMAQLKK
jgi:hypothetical protein